MKKNRVNMMGFQYIDARPENRRWCHHLKDEMGIMVADHLGPHLIFRVSGILIL